MAAVTAATAATATATAVQVELTAIERERTAKKAPKAWTDASWYLLEMVRSGELGNNLIKHALARIEFDTSDTLIVATVKHSRSKQYHGYALGSVEGDVFELHEICSKPGGGSVLMKAVMQHAISHGCTSIHLDSVASSIMWYWNQGFQLAKLGAMEPLRITQLANQFRQTRFTSFKEAIADESYAQFLHTLVKARLTRSSTVTRLEECDDTGGYSMMYYLPATRAAASRKRKRKDLDTTSHKKPQSR